MADKEVALFIRVLADVVSTGVSIGVCNWLDTAGNATSSMSGATAAPDGEPEVGFVILRPARFISMLSQHFKAYVSSSLRALE
jgi:hypothetical protein